MRTPCADDRLRTDLAALTQRDPRAGLVIGPCLAAGLPGDALLAEASKAAVALGDSESLPALERLRLDYQARRTEQEGSRLEGEVKDDDWRHYEVIPVAKSLIELEPSNTSALFDLGQVFSTMRETRNAIDQYAQDVTIDPSEYEAQTALDRAGLEMRPQATAGADYFQEHGFDGLANIQRTFYRANVRTAVRGRGRVLQLRLRPRQPRPEGRPPAGRQHLVRRLPGQVRLRGPPARLRPGQPGDVPRPHFRPRHF